MNAIAEKFQAYLEANVLTALFTAEDLEDKVHTCIFRSRLEINGQILPIAVIIDDSIYTMVRVQITGILTPAQCQAITGALNDLNILYKPFKYALYQDNALYLDACIPSVEKNFDPMLVHEMITVILQHLNEQYSSIMHKVWSEQ